MNRISIRSFVVILALCLTCLTPLTALSSATTDFEESIYYLAVKSTILENFADSDPQITYDSDSSLLSISLLTPDGTALGLIAGGDEVENSWNGLITNMNTLSDSVHTTCTKGGYSVNCAIFLISDVNADNVLFSSLNGFTIYNVLDEE